MIVKKKVLNWISKFKPGVQFYVGESYFDKGSSINIYSCNDYPKYSKTSNWWTIETKDYTNIVIYDLVYYPQNKIIFYNGSLELKMRW